MVSPTPMRELSEQTIAVAVAEEARPDVTVPADLVLFPYPQLPKTEIERWGVLPDSHAAVEDWSISMRS